MVRVETWASLDICATLEAVTIYRVVFEGPASLAVSVATALADAEGVELISSDPLAVVDDHTVRLALAVEGALESVTEAVASISDGMPTGAAIELTDE